MSCISISIFAGISPPVNMLVAENRKLRSDNEKLLSKLSQSKGVLKDTLERLASNQSNHNSPHIDRQGNNKSTPKEPKAVLPSASRTRLFSQAINACQLDKQIASITQKDKRTNLKEEFLEFSRTHTSSPKKPSGKRGNRRNASPTKQSNTSK